MYQPGREFAHYITIAFTDNSSGGEQRDGTLIYSEKQMHAATMIRATL
jgi:hypothetical protein